MTADLQENVIFRLFTCLQILQPNEWMITFKVSWCHMKISCHFMGVWDIKKMKFSMTADLQKNVAFDHYTLFQILQMSELLKFRCPNVVLWWFPAIWRASEFFFKKLKFWWPRTCRKMWFLDFSHVCRFCSQMSELLKFRCPDVVLWWFPAILRGFKKMKINVFDLRTRRKMFFLDFSHVCRFCSETSVLLHVRCPDVKTFEVLDVCGPAEKYRLLDISHFCRFCSQMSELLHFRCPDVVL